MNTCQGNQLSPLSTAYIYNRHKFIGLKGRKEERNEGRKRGNKNEEERK
jgi:hypothetical protein